MKISIVIPIFDRAQLLAYSLYLYTKQTMKDFEIIIVDDGSMDNALEVCKAFSKYLKIRYFYSNRKDGSVYQSGGPLINFAVKNIALADVILYSDAEVMPFPNFVENHRWKNYVAYDKFKDITEILQHNTGRFLKVTIEAIPIGETKTCVKCDERFQCLTTKVRG